MSATAIVLPAVPCIFSRTGRVELSLRVADEADLDCHDTGFFYPANAN